jgi:uncharacterized protein
VDPRKAAANLRKHGVDFADACAVFEDTRALTIPDPDHEEERFVTLALDSLAGSWQSSGQNEKTTFV